MSRRRVVITGLGVVTGLGPGAEALWRGLMEGRSALGPITSFDAAGFPCRLAGEAAGVEARAHVPKSYRKAVKVMARDTELAVVAAKLAAADAGVVTREQGEGETTFAASRSACHIGAGLIAAETRELTTALATARDESGEFSWRRWGTAEEGGEQAVGAMNNLPPLWMLKYLPNMPSCHVTILHGLEGPSNTITNAEASGLLSIGESSRIIERGDADMGFAGGAESKVNPMGLTRMGLAGRLADTDGVEAEGSEAWSLVRPFDPEAPGTLLGEAGGLLVLEAAEEAARRGARVYAEVAGFGAAQSPAPTVPPFEAGDRPGTVDGLALAIRRALEDAGVEPSQIGAIVPHAPGIALLDEAEGEALRSVFGELLGRIPLVTLCPNIGDCVAGNGGVQAAVGAMCLLEGRVPARLHGGRVPGDILAGASAPASCTASHVLVCSPSLGGSNAALVLRAAG